MLPEITLDKIGRTYCKAHNRETCDVCCMSFDIPNRLIEEEKGLKKKRTDVEKVAGEKASLIYAMKGMEQMIPRPNKEVWKFHREQLRIVNGKLKRLEEAGEDVASAMEKAIEEQDRVKLERDAIVQSWSKLNPGKMSFDIGGEETQKIYDQFVACPPTKSKRTDAFTCNYCGLAATKELKICGRCKKVSYCNVSCQKAAWKAHKIICVPGKERKALPLSWKEVEAHGVGVPVQGRKLEVRVILDESSPFRQVVKCKDRSGVIRRLAAYNDARSIPNLKQGSILKWKNPRYHYFMDGSSGARIEEDDLNDITII